MLAFAATAVSSGLTTRALAQGNQSSAALNILFDRFMKENLDLSPTAVTSLGLDTGERARQKGEIDDSSEAGVAKQKAIVASQLARLMAFDRKSLSPADAIS